MTPPPVQELEHAILYGDRRRVAAILDAEPGLIDAPFPDNLGLTPLMWACRNRRESIVAELLDRNADPDLVNRVEPDGDGGNTALWFTGQGPAAGTTGIAARLLAAAADVDAPGEHGQTPLMIAAAWCHLDLVQLLIDHGADPGRTDHAGRTPAAMLLDMQAWAILQSPRTPDQQRFLDRAPRVIEFFNRP